MGARESIAFISFVCLNSLKNFAFHRPPILVVEFFLLLSCICETKIASIKERNQRSAPVKCDIQLDIKPTANNRNVGGTV
jgi:hypothetical protein